MQSISTTGTVKSSINGTNISNSTYSTAGIRLDASENFRLYGMNLSQTANAVFTVSPTWSTIKAGRAAPYLQELAYGGLKASTVRRLEELGDQLDGDNPRVRSRRVDNRPLAGTRLIREWKGSNHEVIVQPDYFEFNGRRYKSLSHIAREITGTIWNGWAFYGFKKTGGLA